MALTWLRRVPIDMPCLDTIARYLFYAFLIDFSLEMLDLIHRIYEADESFRTLDFMVKTRLFVSQIVLQIVARHAGADRPARGGPGDRGASRSRARIYVAAGVLTLVGIFAMRWNVVRGGPFLFFWGRGGRAPTMLRKYNTPKWGTEHRGAGESPGVVYG